MNSIIERITTCPYCRLNAQLPDNIDKDSVISVFEKIINESLSAFTPVEKPFLLNISGIPGSGKSTWCRRIMALSTNLLYITFDGIIKDSRLPYQLAEKDNSQRAFKEWELSARIVGYELLRRAVEQKKNILFEHSSSIPEHVLLFKWLLNHGYDVHFRYVPISIYEAKERIVIRAGKEGRIVPDRYVEERNESLKKLLPEYQALCTTYKDL